MYHEVLASANLIHNDERKLRSYGKGHLWNVSWSTKTRDWRHIQIQYRTEEKSHKGRETNGMNHKVRGGPNPVYNVRKLRSYEIKKKKT